MQAAKQAKCTSKSTIGDPDIKNVTVVLMERGSDVIFPPSTVLFQL